jgi:hypothetical protein
MFHFLVASQTLGVSLCPDDSNGNEEEATMQDTISLSGKQYLLLL